MFDASVIIPTYNRKDSLLKTLEALDRQSPSTPTFEVLVVDDGSIDNTKGLFDQAFHFSACYIHQENQGSAVARNTGASKASGKLLIFLDDDMIVEPDYVSGLFDEHGEHPRIVGMGKELPYLPPNPTPYAKLQAERIGKQQVNPAGEFVDFTECVTNNLSVEATDFVEIGRMQDVAGDGPTWWGDVDFGYRAMKQGFRFRRSGSAACRHCDYSIGSLEVNSKRLFTASKMAIALFHKFPEIQSHLPMFYDKLPVDWQQDSAQMVLRKLVRPVTSAAPSLWAVEQVTSIVEKSSPSSPLLPHLYRWISGGYIYQGFHAGLREYGPL
ncbi:MAG: glycosyltransferase family 2 protein [Chloroflexota bacterium]